MPKKSFTILIIDNKSSNLVLLETILNDQGYRVVSALSGSKGRELAAQINPDLILLAVMMPMETGFETCHKLKRNAKTTNIPIVFISAIDDIKSKVEGLSIGGWDYISIPFHKEEVLARVKNYLKLNYAFKRIINEQSQSLQQIKEAQEAILIKPEDFPEANFTIYYSPIQEAGGDFYDVFRINPNLVAYFISDMSGHDLSASFTNAALKTLIRQNSSQLYRPDETIRLLNGILRSIFTETQHITAIYALFNQSTSILQIVNAAHLPILLIKKDKSFEWIKSEGDIIGVFESAYFQLEEITIQRGDRVLLFSDGLVEKFGNNAKAREKGLAELKDLGIETASTDRETAVNMIISQMFSNSQKPDDDILLMVIDF